MLMKEAKMRQLRFVCAIGLVLWCSIIWRATQGSIAEAQALPEATIYVDRAVIAYEEKRYDEALQELQEALRLDPENVDALYYQGLVYVALNRIAEAQAAWEKARALRPTDRDVAFQLGTLYFSREQYEQAEPLAMNMRKLLCVLTVCMLLGILMYSGPLRPDLGWAQGFDLLELCKETDEDLRLCAQVELESKLGLVSIPAPPADAILQPVQRIPRHLFGVVGDAPLGAADLNALIFPGANAREREAVLEGLEFFTTEQTAATGRGAVSNQPNCLGCHRNSEDAVNGLVQTVSPVARAARSTPTNFEVTAGDQEMGGVAADVDLVLNPTPDLDNPGRTAAFTIFGDFCTLGAPCQQRGLPGNFDGLARPPFFGFVQHTRPSVPTCRPDPLPPFALDPNLAGLDPDEGWMVGWVSPAGFRRQVAERAAPAYIGRGLMETIPDQDIVALADPNDDRGAPVLGCSGDCISGRANMATTIQTINGGDTVPRLGRFGLRGQGPQLIVFDAVGAQEEVGATSVLRFTENIGPEGCVDGVPDPDIPLETIFSLRNLIRMMTLPELGGTLLGLLQSVDPTAPQPEGSHAAMVQRGAMLFGVDLVAFANRMIPGRMPAGGDGRNLHAINTDSPMLNCAGCHSPVQRTGRSRATVGGGISATCGRRSLATCSCTTWPWSRPSGLRRPHGSHWSSTAWASTRSICSAISLRMRFPIRVWPAVTSFARRR
jgi:hypothetical protein